MVADHREGVTALHHMSGDAQGVRRAWPPVYQIAEKQGAAAGRRGYGDGLAVPLHPVSQLAEQFLKLISAAVNVADDVEPRIHHSTRVTL